MGTAVVEGPSVTVRIKTVDRCNEGDAVDCPSNGFHVATALEKTLLLSDLTVGSLESCVPLRGHITSTAMNKFKMLYTFTVLLAVVGVPVTLVGCMARCLWYRCSSIGAGGKSKHD